MNITVVTGNYPVNFEPNRGAFVYNLLQVLAQQHNVTVISPLKAHNWHKYRSGGYGKEKCQVIRPLSFSFSNKKIFGVDTFKLTLWAAKRSLTKSLRRMAEKPDIIYCHFLVSALPVIDYAGKNDIPVVVASGESRYDIWGRLNTHERNKLLHGVDKIIAVSETNSQELIELGFATDKITVIPNAVNYELFRPLNKIQCKELLGFTEEEFVVGFIGHFIERKGPNRLIQAIKELKDPSIKLVCVGRGGALEPNDFTTVIPPVPNAELPEIFNAFDVFVLPTLSEGHCNVIEEAMACCVPVISSKGTSVEEQLSDGLGVLIDPRNIGEIAESIKMLKEKPEVRENLIDKMKKRIGKNSIQKRADKINETLRSII